MARTRKEKGLEAERKTPQGDQSRLAGSPPPHPQSLNSVTFALLQPRKEAGHPLNENSALYLHLGRPKGQHGFPQTLSLREMKELALNLQLYPPPPSQFPTYSLPWSQNFNQLSPPPASQPFVIYTNVQ